MCVLYKMKAGCEFDEVLFCDVSPNTMCKEYLIRTATTIKHSVRWSINQSVNHSVNQVMIKVLCCSKQVNRQQISK